MVISKSDYMLFLRHPAWIWVKKNNPSKIPPVDAATQAMFDVGYAFESYAESLFPGGERVTWDKSDWNSYRTLPKRTLQAINSGSKIIFQGRFEWKEFTFLPDIIEVVEGKTINLYEIKSSTRVKTEHIYDLAFQKVVLEGNGFRVKEIKVIHVNNQYIRHGDIDSKELVSFENVTDKVDEVAIKTPLYMQAALSSARSKKMPDPNPDLTKLGAKSDWLKVYNNLFPLPPKSWPEDTAPEVDKQQVASFLKGLKYPMYFFDYETMQGLVPYFDGQRPYQQIPFQYSLHVIPSPGADIEHIEYLHQDRSNPAVMVAKKLVNDIGGQGSVITWNMSFEKSINKALGEMFPEYKVRLDDINDRTVDLMIPFKAKWYSDPRFEGSASLKKVLPVMCPDLSYATLSVQDGNTAQRVWMETVLDGKNADRREQILSDLIKYCKLDTWAMVRIWQELNSI